MSNLDNLVSKILSDCRSEAQKITQTAEEQANKVIDGYVSDANKEKARIISNAGEEAKKAKELAVSAKKLELRDSMLKEKQKAIDDVLKAAVEQLKNMPENDFVAFVSKYLKKIGISGGEEIILPQKFHGSLDKINAELAGSGALKLSTAQNIDGGFILLKNGVLNNNTFESLADYYRDELEVIIAKNLF